MPELIPIYVPEAQLAILRDRRNEILDLQLQLRSKSVDLDRLLFNIFQEMGLDPETNSINLDSGEIQKGVRK